MGKSRHFYVHVLCLYYGWEDFDIEGVYYTKRDAEKAKNRAMQIGCHYGMKPSCYDIYECALGVSRCGDVPK